MLRQYFAQSLLNEGILSADQVRFLLESKDKHTAGFGVRALCSNMLTAEQIESLQAMEPAAELAATAVSAGYLTTLQRRSLEEMQTTTNLDFAQGMLDEAFVCDYKELEKLVKVYQEKELITVGHALNQAAMKDLNFESLEEEYILYTEYTDMFLRAVSKFMHVDAFINLKPDPFSGEEGKITISQRLNGDIDLITGIMAEESTILAMARKYSQEDIDEVDELAIDSVAEFLNVTNGLYIVNLSNRNLNVDLEPFHSAKNVLPAGNKQIVIRIDIEEGSFDLILAADEIIF